MQAIGRLVRSSSRLSGGSESRSDSPWDATTARERQQYAEENLGHWQQRARNAEKELEVARAAMNSQQDVRGQILKGHSDMYFEGRVQRERMRRNHPSNRAELSVIALAPAVDQDDLRPGLLETPWFRRELKSILETDRRECAEHLATHAYRPEKFFLAKMILRTSGRAMGWLQSLFKHDHSQVDGDGNRMRARETMHPDSKVPAPLIFPVKQVGRLIDAEVRAPDEAMPTRVNMQSEDHRGAVVRDLRATILELIEKVAPRYCGGMASDGSEAKPHWIAVTMDGAGLTHEDNGVRFALSPASVEDMNQSTHCLRTIVFYRAAGSAEDYDTLWARAQHARQELCKIWKERGMWVWRESQGRHVFMHVRFMLTADKAGFCHLCGRRNQNYGNFGVFCDCCDKDLYNFKHNPLTHYGRVTYETRVARSHTALWEACEQCEPDENWTVHCDCCQKVRTPCSRASLSLTPCRPVPHGHRRPSPKLTSRRSNGRSRG